MPFTLVSIISSQSSGLPSHSLSSPRLSPALFYQHVDRLPLLGQPANRRLHSGTILHVEFEIVHSRGARILEFFLHCPQALHAARGQQQKRTFPRKPPSTRRANSRARACDENYSILQTDLWHASIVKGGSL
jgi:hypothetical protein